MRCDARRRQRAVSWKWREARCAARLVNAETLLVKNDFGRVQIVRANRFDWRGNASPHKREIPRSKAKLTARNGASERRGPSSRCSSGCASSSGAQLTITTATLGFCVSAEYKGVKSLCFD